MMSNKYIRTVAGILFLVTAVICGETYAQKGSTSAKKPFQKTISLNIPVGESFGQAEIAIPEGKLMVIENVSARLTGRAVPAMSFTTWYDDNGNGQLDASDESVQDIVLNLQIERYEDPELFIWSASNRVLVFAGERIGSSHLGVRMMVQTSYPLLRPSQARMTISGYLEDLPQ